MRFLTCLCRPEKPPSKYLNSPLSDSGIARPMSSIVKRFNPTKITLDNAVIIDFVTLVAAMAMKNPSIMQRSDNQRKCIEIRKPNQERLDRDPLP